MAGRVIGAPQQPPNRSLLREGESLPATRFLLSPTNPDLGLEAERNKVRPKPMYA